MSENQQMPDAYSSSMLLHGLSSLGLDASTSIKKIQDQYLVAFLLAFFLKNNEDQFADTQVEAFETYLASIQSLDVASFSVVLEHISKDLLILIRNELILLLKNKQNDKIRQKFQNIDLYQQINTNMLSVLIDGKKALQLLTNKLSGFNTISSNDFVGRFFWMELQKDLSDRVLNAQILDDFQISSVMNLIADCQNVIQTKYTTYLKHMDQLFEQQIAKDTNLFDPLTKSDIGTSNFSENLKLMLFFLIGQTVLICLDVMLTTNSKEDIDEIKVQEDTDSDDSSSLLLNVSRGVLALGIIGCLVGLIPKK
jgi:hypothetical protein